MKDSTRAKVKIENISERPPIKILFICLKNINIITQNVSKVSATEIIFVINIELKTIILKMSRLSTNKIIIAALITIHTGIGETIKTDEKNKIFIINKRRDFIIYSIKIVLFQAFYLD